METVGIGTSFTVPLFHLCHLFASDPTANVEFNGRQPAAKHAKPRRTSASFFFFFRCHWSRLSLSHPTHQRHLESDISSPTSRTGRSMPPYKMPRHTTASRRFKTRPGSSNTTSIPPEINPESISQDSQGKRRRRATANERDAAALLPEPFPPLASLVNQSEIVPSPNTTPPTCPRRPCSDRQ